MASCSQGIGGEGGEILRMTLAGIADFARQEDLALVLLFGSRGQGNDRDDSDLDLALMPRQGCATRDGVERRLVNLLRRSDLDLLWLPHASPLARWRVSETAKVLYQDTPDRFRHFVQEAALGRSDAAVWQYHDERFINRGIEGDWSMDKELVTRKLAQIVQYTEQLEKVLDTDETAFSRDFMIHRVAERQIELLVESAAKLNTELAQSLAKIAPSDYYSSFFSAAATGWVDNDTARELATLTGLRNRLVHQYEDIRLPRLFHACRESLPHWRAYIASIAAHLKDTR